MPYSIVKPFLDGRSIPTAGENQDDEGEDEPA